MAAAIGAPRSVATVNMVVDVVAQRSVVVAPRIVLADPCTEVATLKGAEATPTNVATTVVPNSDATPSKGLDAERY